MKYHLLLLATSLLFSSSLFSGCGSASFEIKPHEALSSEWSGTGLLLDYDLLHLAHSDDCTLVFQNSEQEQGYRLKLRAASHMVLADIPPGTYTGKTLACSHFQDWELNQFLKGPFTIAPGKINYLGKVTFAFSKDQSAMTVNLGDQTEVTDDINTDVSHFPDTWKSFLFNPFTQRPIDRETLTKKTAYRLDVRTTYFLKASEASGPSTKGLQASAEECEIMELRTFPYRLGNLSYTGTYEGRKLVKLKKEGHNSFSDAFTSCIEQSFNDFTPADGTKLKVVISI
jgi:hypothetical protein